MVVPSKSFTVIPASDVDPDSPITTGLMTALSDNTVHLEEWLGDGFTAAKDHDHDGVNAKKIAGANLPFDQSTGNGASITAGAGAVDVATITVASADLTANRAALIIASGDADPKGTNGDLAMRLLVDGVAKQSVDVFVNPSVNAGKDAWALSEIVTLTSGADRIIKVQGTSASVGADVANTNLLSVLIN